MMSCYNIDEMLSMRRGFHAPYNPHIVLFPQHPLLLGSMASSKDDIIIILACLSQEEGLYIINIGLSGPNEVF